MTATTNTRPHAIDAAAATATASASPDARPVSAQSRRGGRTRTQVSVSRASLSEWTKLRSLRSTWFLALIAVVVGTGLAAAVGWGVSTGDTSGFGPEGAPGVIPDTTSTILRGTVLASLVLGVLGALSASSEYATGSISVWLTAVPRRWPIVAAKALVLVALVAPVALVLSMAALWVGGSFLSGDLAVALGDPGVLGAVLGNTGYLVAVALLGLGLGFLVRSTAVAVTLLVAVVFVLPPVLPLIPLDWVTGAANYFPGSAGDSLTTADGGGVLSVTAAVMTLTGWVLLPLAAGTARLMRTDA